MKMIRVCGLLLVSARIVAGEFINLDFDSVDVSRNKLVYGDAYTGGASYLLPGWTVQTGLDLRIQTEIGYSRVPGGFFFYNGVAIVPSFGTAGYSIGLTPDRFDSSGMPVRIFQVGLVPAWANQIEVDDANGAMLFGVNGKDMALTSGNYRFDVSEYTGKEVELSFRVISSFSSISGVRFLAVPEPDIHWLGLLGLGCCFCWRLRQRYMERC